MPLLPPGTQPSQLASGRRHADDDVDERRAQQDRNSRRTGDRITPTRPKAGGKWNTYEITANGPQLTVVMNGIKTAEVQHSQFAEGAISLQFGNLEKSAPGGPIKWRKVQIRPL